MKFDALQQLVTTTTCESSVISGLWLSRSGVLLKNSDGSKLTPIFGFSGSFDKDASRRKSIFELIEHLAFHPQKPLGYVSVNAQARIFAHADESASLPIDRLLLGATAFGEKLHGNGCAVHADRVSAAAHATNELLERHYCCEMWYKRRVSLCRIESARYKVKDCKINLALYRLIIPSDAHLIIATLYSSICGFFAIGAAWRTSFEEACNHATGEAASLYQDAMMNRAGHASTEAARTNILSLRDINESSRRKRYFERLLAEPDLARLEELPEAPVPTVYTFNLPCGLVAARALSGEVLTPRRFHASQIETPVLPIF